ncbi:MAG: Asp23/Gls24 family envelope stress response protein [Clostridia bacterium]|nr:Asp23/Gls24 family envelope stress response protein [Clostridia bacterium]
MANKNNQTTPSGKVVYNSSIVRGIIVLAVAEVEGVAVNGDEKGVKDSVKLEFSNDYNVSVEVTVSVRYGYNIPDVAYNIQQSVKHNVEAMSNYKISKIDVHVVDVLFDDGEHE